MEISIDDLLAKVRVIAGTPRGELLRQIVDLMYERVEEEYGDESLTPEDLEAIERGREDVNQGRYSTLEEYEIKSGNFRNLLKYNDLFSKMEATLKQESSLSEEDFERNWGRFKNYHYKNDSNDDIFWKLVQVVFYSGMKASIVTSKIPALKKYLYDYKKVKEYDSEYINKIMNDQNMIRNKAKIEACIRNASLFDNIVNIHGSFSNYLESFGDLNGEITLEKLKNELKHFEFLGPITSYHFMLDLGLKVWKPDRVICRILKRLQLIDNLEDIDQAIKVGREIADQVELPIRYIDIIFVKYGQIGDEKPFGLKTGICLEKNPRCSICRINEYCTYQN